jgi:hypothetical protein
MNVLLYDDLGRLTLRRLRPWHRVLARSQAARFDLELADGMNPEASATLAARAIRLTSTDFRQHLAVSLQRILAAAGKSSAVMRSPAVAARPPYGDGAAMPGRAGRGYPAGMRARAVHLLPVGAARPPGVPLGLERVSQSAPLLAALASHLAEPGTVRVQGVAMVSQLLADGTGPLYREACRDDLDAIIERATYALTR